MGEALSEDTVKALEHLYDEVKRSGMGSGRRCSGTAPNCSSARAQHVVQQLVERRQKVKNQRAGADKKHQQSDDRVHAARNALAPKESVWSLALRGATQRSTMRPNAATMRPNATSGKGSRYSGER